MSNVTVSGPGVSAAIDLGNTSLFSKANLTTLVPKTKDFAAEFTKPVSAGKLNSISLTPSYGAPAIALDATKTLAISTRLDTALRVSRAADSPLFGKDDFAPAIEISGPQCWIGFEIGGSVGVAVSGQAPNGIGVAIDNETAATFAAWKLCDGSELLSDALRSTLSGFTIAANADVVLAQQPGTVLASDVSGTVTVTGSWSVPAAVNSLALADTPTPIQIEVQAGASVTLAGSIAIKGEFIFRSWKKSEQELVIGLYKKKGTTLSAQLIARGGIKGEVMETDVVGKVFRLLGPDADVPELGADPAGIRAALKKSVDKSLSMSLNATCSAAFTDESAFIYTLDLTSDQDSTKQALNEAIAGDWTKIAQLKNARQDRSIIAHTVETGHKLVVNVLGAYSFASIADFMRKCTVVHCPADGSATITDVETAKRLTVAAAPFQAAQDQLRKALGEAAISTAAYTFAKGANKSTLTSSQTLVIYNDAVAAKDLAKELVPAVALDMATREQIAAQVGAAKHSHTLVQFEQKIEDDAARQMFFDPATGQPWTEAALRLIGIGQLRALLDPNDDSDRRRLEFLANFPSDPPSGFASVDWFDITWWAESVAGAASAYAGAQSAFEKVPPGEDPAANADFMHARGVLAKALLEMSQNEHSAFTPGWPLAVMNRIARGQAETSLKASWDSKPQLDLPVKTATAVTRS